MSRKGRFKLKGVDKVMRNLNKELKRITVKSLAGLIEAAIIIRRDMHVSPPTIPWDTGNLNASWFLLTGLGADRGDGGGFTGPDANTLSGEHKSVKSRQKGKIAGKPAVAIGFSANYAAAVHEDTSSKRKRAGSGGKFLESALKRNKPLIIAAIVQKAKVK